MVAIVCYQAWEIKNGRQICTWQVTIKQFKFANNDDDNHLD